MIFELENITVKKLFTSSNFDSYAKLQSMMNARPVFSGKEANSLNSLEFGQVAKIKRIVSKPTHEGMFEMFRMVFDVNKKQYQKAKAIEFFYALNHIKSEILKLVNREKKMLSGDEDPVWDMAGGKELNRFAELNTLVKLGKDYGMAPREIERWTYATVFSLVFHDKTLREVQKRYYELKRKDK